MIDRTVSYFLGATCLGLAALSAVLLWEVRAAERSEQRMRATLAEERADRAQEREALTAAALKASERARELESLWRTKHEEVQAHARKQVQDAAAAAARARSAADLLQQRAEVIAAQCANPQRDTGPDPSFAPRGPAAADPGTVLTQLLRGVTAAAAELAAVADARGAAGAGCERAYDALRAPP